MIDSTDSVASLMDELDDQIVQVEKLLNVHNERLKLVKALLQQQSLKPAKTGCDIETGVATLSSKIDVIEQKLHTWEIQWGSSTSLLQNASLDETVAELKEEICLLKQRVVGSC
jgi:hypothetical protein